VIALAPAATWSLVLGLSLVVLAAALALSRRLTEDAAGTSAPVHEGHAYAVYSCVERGCRFEDYDPAIPTHRALAESADHWLQTGHAVIVTGMREFVVGED